LVTSFQYLFFQAVPVENNKTKKRINHTNCNHSEATTNKVMTLESNKTIKRGKNGNRKTIESKPLLLRSIACKIHNVHRWKYPMHQFLKEIKKLIL
jgi:hypothetical protein